MEVYHRAGQKYGSRRSAAEIAARFRQAFADAEFADRVEVNRPTLRNGDCPPVDSANSRWLRRPTSQHRERARWWKIVACVFDDVDGHLGELFEDLWNHFARSESWTLFADVMPVWQALSHRNLLLGVASNFDDRLVPICRQLLPPEVCENLYCSSDLGYPKPSPEFFAAVQRRCGLAKDEIMLVGDDLESDFCGARAAGWHALWLDRNHTPNPGVDPRLVIHSLHDLLACAS